MSFSEKCPLLLTPILLPCQIEDLGVISFYELATILGTSEEDSPLELDFSSAAQFTLNWNYFIRHLSSGHYCSSCEEWKEKVSSLAKTYYQCPQGELILSSPVYAASFFDEWQRKLEVFQETSYLHRQQLVEKQKKSEQAAEKIHELENLRQRVNECEQLLLVLRNSKIKGRLLQASSNKRIHWHYLLFGVVFLTVIVIHFLW